MSKDQSPSLELKPVNTGGPKGENIELFGKITSENLDSNYEVTSTQISEALSRVFIDIKNATSSSNKTKEECIAEETIQLIKKIDTLLKLYNGLSIDQSAGVILKTISAKLNNSYSEKELIKNLELYIYKLNNQRQVIINQTIDQVYTYLTNIEKNDESIDFLKNLIDPEIELDKKLLEQLENDIRFIHQNSQIILLACKLFYKDTEKLLLHIDLRLKALSVLTPEIALKCIESDITPLSYELEELSNSISKDHPIEKELDEYLGEIYTHSVDDEGLVTTDPLATKYTSSFINHPEDGDNSVLDLGLTPKLLKYAQFTWLHITKDFDDNNYELIKSDVYKLIKSSSISLQECIDIREEDNGLDIVIKLKKHSDKKLLEEGEYLVKQIKSNGANCVASNNDNLEKNNSKLVNNEDTYADYHQREIYQNFLIVIKKLLTSLENQEQLIENINYPDEVRLELTKNADTLREKIVYELKKLKYLESRIIEKYNKIDSIVTKGDIIRTKYSGVHRHNFPLEKILIDNGGSYDKGVYCKYSSINRKFEEFIIVFDINVSNFLSLERHIPFIKKYQKFKGDKLYTISYPEKNNFMMTIYTDLILIHNSKPFVINHGFKYDRKIKINYGPTINKLLSIDYDSDGFPEKLTFIDIGDNSSNETHDNIWSLEYSYSTGNYNLNRNCNTSKSFKSYPLNFNSHGAKTGMMWDEELERYV